MSRLAKIKLFYCTDVAKLINEYTMIPTIEIEITKLDLHSEFYYKNHFTQRPKTTNVSRDILAAIKSWAWSDHENTIWWLPFPEDGHNIDGHQYSKIIKISWNKIFSIIVRKPRGWREKRNITAKNNIRKIINEENENKK